jgi:hypothetical protein
MIVQVKSIQKITKHLKDVLATFNYQNSTVTPSYGNTDIYISVYADSDNPVGKFYITGRYSVMHDYFYIDLLGLSTRNENMFFQTLHTLHKSITHIQRDFDNAH